nr:hypothetical protein [Candidatus Sigynarchaeota archaeon]
MPDKQFVALLPPAGGADGIDQFHAARDRIYQRAIAVEKLINRINLDKPLTAARLDREKFHHLTEHIRGLNGEWQRLVAEKISAAQAARANFLADVNRKCIDAKSTAVRAASQRIADALQARLDFLRDVNQRVCRELEIRRSFIRTKVSAAIESEKARNGAIIEAIKKQEAAIDDVLKTIRFYASYVESEHQLVIQSALAKIKEIVAANLARDKHRREVLRCLVNSALKTETERRLAWQKKLQCVIDDQHDKRENLKNLVRNAVDAEKARKKELIQRVVARVTAIEHDKRENLKSLVRNAVDAEKARKKELIQRVNSGIAGVRAKQAELLEKINELQKKRLQQNQDLCEAVRRVVKSPYRYYSGTGTTLHRALVEIFLERDAACNTRTPISELFDRLHEIHPEITRRVFYNCIDDFKFTGRVEIYQADDGEIRDSTRLDSQQPTMFQAAILASAASHASKCGSFSEFHAAFEQRSKRSVNRTSVSVAIHQLQGMGLLSVPWKIDNGTIAQQQEALRRKRRNYELKNHLTSRQRRALTIGCIALCFIFSVQLVQNLDSYFQMDPATYAISNVTTSATSTYRMGDNYTISFTSASREGTGWLIYFDARNKEFYRQPVIINEGENRITTNLASDNGFKVGHTKLKVYVTYLFMGFILRTNLVCNEVFTIIKEITAIDLDCAISVEDPDDPMKISYSAILRDDEQLPVEGKPVEISWFNVAVHDFVAIASVTTNGTGGFSYVEHRSVISPYPFLARARFLGDADYLNCTADDSVSIDQVYKSWQMAGPSDESDYIYSGFEPAPVDHIATNQTHFVAAYDWGTTGNQTKDFGEWKVNVMQGSAFSGISNVSLYVGGFSMGETVSFVMKSQWLYFQGKNATSASISVRFRSLWEKHGSYWDTKRGNESIYTVFISVFDTDDMMIYYEEIARSDAIPWTTTCVNLTAFFQDPMRFRIGIGGVIKTMGTTITADLWDEQMLLFDSLRCEVFHGPVFVASSAMNAWQGYDAYITSAEATNDSLFSASKDATLTNMPARYSSVPDALHGTIYTPFGQGSSSNIGLLTDFHFQSDWRKPGLQTWGLGNGTSAQDGFDYGSSTGSNYLNASSTMVNGAEANWKVEWSGGVQHSWAELVLKSNIATKFHAWVGLGTEFQIPAAPGKAFSDARIRISLDMIVCDGLLKFPKENYNITVLVQGADGLHVIYKNTSAYLVQGHHDLDIDATPFITNCSAPYYLMVILEGSWSLYKRVKAQVESIEVLATFTESGSFIGVAATASKGVSSYSTSPRAIGDWEYAITSYNLTEMPVAVQFLGSGSISRIMRGGAADTGIHTRIDIVVESSTGSCISYPVHSGWTEASSSALTFNWTVPAISLATTTSFHYRFSVDVPPHGTGLGSETRDIFAVRLTGLHLVGVSSDNSTWTLIDMMENASAWSYSTSTADGEITPQLTGSGSENIAMRIAALASTAPAAGEKLFAAKLVSPVMYASTLRSKTFSTLELEFTPFIDSPVPVHWLASEFARVRITLEVQCDFYGAFSPLASFLVDDFIIDLTNYNTTRECRVDISQFIGVPVPGYDAYINKLKLGIGITIDLSNASTPGVAWGCLARNLMMVVSDLPPEPQFVNLPSPIHGVFPITIQSQGDEVKLYLEYAIDGSAFSLYNHTHTRVNPTTWLVWFDTRAFNDTGNLSLRVFMEDAVGLKNHPAIYRQGIIIDNSAPVITGTSLTSNTVLHRNTNISLSTPSIDAAKAIFEFVLENSTWTGGNVTTYTDDDGADGFSHYLMIYDLLEGTYKVRMILLDKTFDPAQSDSIEVHNVTIIHVFPEIVAPVYGIVTNGYFRLEARTGTSLVTAARAYYGITADKTMENVSTWVCIGNSSCPVNNSFAFQLEPSHFGSIEAWIFLRVDFSIGTVLNDTAYLLVYVDTIVPSITLGYTPGNGPDQDGLISSPIEFTATSTTLAQIATLDMYAISPDIPAPVTIQRALHPSFPWTFTYIPDVDGCYQFYAVARDEAGNVGISNWLNATVDLRPLSLRFVDPVLNRTIWYNDSLPTVSVPMMLYSPDCDVNVSSTRLEYKWIYSSSWMPFNASWSSLSLHEIVAAWTMNVSQLNMYPFYQFRVTAEDRRGTASASTGFLLVTVNDTTAPSLVSFTNNLRGVAWGDLIALEIEAPEALFIEVWNKTPGLLYNPTDEHGLVTRLFGNTTFHAIVNSSAFPRGTSILYLRAVDAALNQNITTERLIVLTDWSCNVSDGAFVRTTNGTLNISLTVRETDLDGIEVSLYRYSGTAWALDQISTTMTRTGACTASFAGLDSGEYQVQARVLLAANLTTFPTTWQSTYIPAIRFTVDDISPSNVLLNNIVNYTHVSGGSLVLNVSAVENSGNVSYFLRINGTVQSLEEYGAVGVDGTITWNGVGFLPDGQYEIQLIAQDLAGNNGTAIQTQVILVDNSPPVLDSVTAIPEISPSGVIITKDMVVISFASHDSRSPLMRAWMELNDSSITLIPWVQACAGSSINATAMLFLGSLGLVPGVYDLRVCVQGTAGIRIIEYQVMYDPAPPEAWYLSPTTGSTAIAENLTFVVHCEDISGIESVLFYRGMPGTGGVLIGRGLPYNASYSTWYYTMVVDRYIASSYYAVVTDILGNTKMTSIDQVTSMPRLQLTTSMLDGSIIGSPVTLNGQVTINSNGLEPGDEFQVGVWYSVPEDSSTWVYLTSSATIQYTSPSTTESYFYELDFDTDLITGVSTSQYVPTPIGIAGWTSAMYSSNIMGFAANFDGAGGAEILYIQIGSDAGSVLLQAYGVKQGSGGWVIMNSPIFSLGSFSNFKIIDAATGDVSVSGGRDGRSELVLLDNQGYVHVIRFTTGITLASQSMQDLGSFTSVDIDTATGDLVFGCITESGPGIWRWELGETASITGNNFVQVSTDTTTSITSLDVADLALTGANPRHVTVFGTEDSLGYIDASNAIHIIDTGFSVGDIKIGNIDSDGKNEIVLAVNTEAGNFVMISYSWVDNAGILSWSSSIIKDAGKLTSFTSIDIGIGLPENPNDDIIVANGVNGVVNYQLKNNVVETMIPVQPGSWKSYTTETTVDGRYDVTTKDIAPFSSVKGCDTIELEALTTNERYGIVAINELSFGIIAGNFLFDYIELYNWGTETVDLTG